MVSMNIVYKYQVAYVCAVPVFKPLSSTQHSLERSIADRIVYLFHKTNTLRYRAGQRSSEQNRDQIDILGPAAGREHAVLGAKPGDDHGIHRQCPELIGQPGFVEGVAISFYNPRIRW